MKKLFKCGKQPGLSFSVLRKGPLLHGETFHSLTVLHKHNALIKPDLSTNENYHFLMRSSWERVENSCHEKCMGF